MTSPARITKHHDIMSGQACIAGTRIPAKAMRSFVDHGFDIPQIMAEYPTLSTEQVRAALVYESRPLRRVQRRISPAIDWASGKMYDFADWLITWSGRWA
jgi:uncharacterized protein (DUF433 family)